MIQALIDRGVIGDFREPDLMRFGFSTLYTRFLDVWQAATLLVEVIQSRAFDQAHFQGRAKVT